MNPTVLAAIISGGWAAVVAAMGYYYNQASSKATVKATNANALAALDAAHDARLWKKKSQAYVEAIYVISRRRADRTDLIKRLGVRDFDKALHDKAVIPREPLPAQLLTFASSPVVEKLEMANKLDDKFRSAAHSLLTNPEDKAFGPMNLKYAMDAGLAANAADKQLEDSIREDLALRPSDGSRQVR